MLLGLHRLQSSEACRVPHRQIPARCKCTSDEHWSDGIIMRGVGGAPPRGPPTWVYAVDVPLGASLASWTF